MKHPIFDAIKRRDRATEIFLAVLESSGLAGAVDAVRADLHIQDLVIVEPTGSKVLSDGILNAMFPRQQQPIEVFHYTRGDGLRA